MKEEFHNNDLETIKKDREIMINWLEKAKPGSTKKLGTDPNIKNLRCPFHADANASATLKSASTSGIYYFKCHACNITYDYISLRAKVDGVSEADVLRQFPKEKVQKIDRETARRITGINMEEIEKKNLPAYDTLEDLVKALPKEATDVVINRYFEDEKNTLTFAVIRFWKGSKKDFRQVSTNQNGKWVMSVGYRKLPLFNLKQVLKCDDVLIVEGEKCVREIHALGIPGLAATTSAGGANAWEKTDWSALKGKSVWFWRDNDANGKVYQDSVIKIIRDYARSIKITNIQDLDLKDKQDAFDYIQKLQQTISKPEEIQQLFTLAYQNATDLHGKSALEQYFEDIHASKLKCLRFPNFPTTSVISKSQMPGSLTVVTAEANGGKSFFLTEIAWRWITEEGLKVRMLMLEDPAKIHLNRALAQMDKNSFLADIDWVFANKGKSIGALNRHIDKIKEFERSLTCTEEESIIDKKTSQMSLDEVADWIEFQAKNGADVIIVDPITAATLPSKLSVAVADQLFIFRVKNILQQTGARLILSTHPRTGQAGAAGLSGLAGGASYPRFSHCVLWIHSLQVEQNQIVLDELGNLKSATYMKEMLILKTRHGKGRGQKIAMGLNHRTLRTEEFGVIQQKDAGDQSFLFTSYSKPDDLYVKPKTSEPTPPPPTKVEEKPVSTPASKPVSAPSEPVKSTQPPTYIPPKTIGKPRTSADIFDEYDEAVSYNALPKSEMTRMV